MTRVNMDAPLSSWDLRWKREVKEVPLTIMVQTTREVGGTWMTVEHTHDTIVSIVAHSQFLRRYPDFPEKLIGGICAIKFPSGAIFDCVMAQHPDKEIRRRCWR